MMRKYATLYGVPTCLLGFIVCGAWHLETLDCIVILQRQPFIIMQYVFLGIFYIYLRIWPANSMLSEYLGYREGWSSCASTKIKETSYFG